MKRLNRNTQHDLKLELIICLNWSMKKRQVLIGSLSSPNFAIWTATMDSSQTGFRGLLKPAKKEVDKYFAHTDAIKYMHSSSFDIVPLFLFRTLKWLTLLFSRLL